MSFEPSRVAGWGAFLPGWLNLSLGLGLGAIVVALRAGEPTLPATETAPLQARLVASSEAGWPQFRGPRRDGICDETGLMGEWPEGGPRLLWQTNGLGRGYSAPILNAGRIFVTGDFEGQLRILALDLQGRLRWQATNGASWTGPYPGARSSPTFHHGRLFHLNAHGRIVGLDPATGREFWGVDLFEQYGGRNITWGLSECLIGEGERIVVTPGGTRALMVALDVKTGAPVWTTEPLRLGASAPPAHLRVEEPATGTDHASYTSPILFEMGGRRHLVSCSLRHVFGVDAESGRLLWTRPLRTQHAVIAATPVLVGNAVLVTAPDTEDGRLYRLHPEGTGVRVEEAWSTRLDTCHGGIVHLNGTLYGSWYRRAKGWVALDAATGRIRYETRELPMGSVLYADRRLYCLSQEGDMALLEPTADGFRFAGRFRLIPGRANDVWAHPVIVDGRLYLRYHDTLYCYDLRPV